MFADCGETVMEIQVELSKLIINENSESQIVVLKELKGNRSLPIMIGIPEVLAIDRYLKKQLPPRPMTHCLLVSMLRQLNAGISKVVIKNFYDGVYYAVIHMLHDDNSMPVDARPSDAIALSMAVECPIFVEDNLLR